MTAALVRALKQLNQQLDGQARSSATADEALATERAAMRTCYGELI